MPRRIPECPTGFLSMTASGLTHINHSVLLKRKYPVGCAVRAHHRKIATPSLQRSKRPTGGSLNAKGEARKALIVYQETLQNGLRPNLSILIAALKACISLRDLETGIEIHSLLSYSGDDQNIVLATTLVHMYAKCGNMLKAKQTFDKICQHDLVSWNALIFGYMENMEYDTALQLFSTMQDRGFTPDSRTYLAVFKACACCASKEDAKEVEGGLVHVESLEKGIAVHSQFAKSQHGLDIFVASSLVDMYAKCGSMIHARSVFDRMPCHDLVSWTAMIYGYVVSRDTKCALQLFACMQDEGFMPNDRSYVAVLKAYASCAEKEDGRQVKWKCVKVESLEHGVAIHSQLAKNGYESDLFVANTLLDMYAKCGSMIHARWVFDKIPHPDLVSWNAMVFGYAETGEHTLALKLFARMQDEGFKPGFLTYVAALKACGCLGALETGRKVHFQICSAGFQNEPVVASCIVAFYSKCGSMLDAEKVFDSMSARNLVTWNGLLAGYAHNGDADQVFKLFKMMREECFHADGVTFLSIVNACSYVGLVDKGKAYLWIMCMHYMISPTRDHYACILDLLGRANHLDDVVEVVKNMAFEPSQTIWTTVLGACLKWKNLVIGSLAFESMRRLEDKDASAYVMMTMFMQFLARERRMPKLMAQGRLLTSLQ